MRIKNKSVVTQTGTPTHPDQENYPGVTYHKCLKRLRPIRSLVANRL